MPDDALKQRGPEMGAAGAQHAVRKRRASPIYRTILLWVMTLGCTTLAADAPTAEPTTRPATRPTTQPILRSAAARAVQRFHHLLKAADTAGATVMLAVSPQPVRDADRRIKRLIGTLAGRNSDFSLLDARESGDVAVVLINDHLKDGRKTIDIKPWYLLRQQGEWKLLGKFTDFELKEYGFDESRLAEYRALEKWAERREPELRKEQPYCGC
jgi:hypothetical protein